VHDSQVVGEVLATPRPPLAVTADKAYDSEKVRQQILTLPPETLVCPGHGPLTTVAEEKAHNPFF